MIASLTKYEKFLFYFTLVDILFAPYFPLFATTFSQLLVFGWVLYKGLFISNQREVYAYCLFAFLVLVSTLLSLFAIPYEINDFFLDNIKIGANIVLGVSYYFFFYYCFCRLKIKMWRWMLAAIVYIGLWAILYYVNMGQFFALKTLFNPRDSMMLYMIEGTVFRFNFIWTDPNNVAYAVVAMLAIMALDNRTPNWALVIALLFTLFVLLLMMSTGGYLTFLLTVPLTILHRLMSQKMSAKGAFSMIFFGFVFLFLIARYSDEILSSDIGQASIQRQGEKNETEEGRPIIWKTLIENKNFAASILFGEGSVILVNGQRYSPHSGHLMFIYGYGFIAYLLYVYIIFRKLRRQRWVSYLPVVSLLIGFTLNIGIGELKYAAILYMVVTYLRAESRPRLKGQNNG